jgi:hypothetical protein
MHKIKVFYYLGGGGGDELDRLSKVQETLVTVRTVLGEGTSVGMEHLYLVRGGIILFKCSLLTF